MYAIFNRFNLEWKPAPSDYLHNAAWHHLFCGPDLNKEILLYCVLPRASNFAKKQNASTTGRKAGYSQ